MTAFLGAGARNVDPVEGFAARLRLGTGADCEGGEGASVEAYSSCSRRGHLKKSRSSRGIGLFQVHAMGPEGRGFESLRARHFP